VHRNRKLDEVAAATLVDLVGKNPTAMLHELAADMRRISGEQWCGYDVCRALHTLGYVRVRGTKSATEADVSEQEEFVQKIQRLMVGPLHFVFIDEVAADSRATNRQYAWALKGLQELAAGVFVRGQRFTTIAGMSADGFVGKPPIMQGAASMDDFVSWFKTEIVPQLGRYPTGQHCVVVMDNCAIHHKETIEELCSITEDEVVWLPPYSPVFNPIELVKPNTGALPNLRCSSSIFE
jgi:hypothetical protein